MSTIGSIKTASGQNRYKAKIQRAGFRARCKNFPTRRSAKQGATERSPIFRTGKSMLLYQLVRSNHETHSPSYLYSRVQG